MSQVVSVCLMGMFILLTPTTPDHVSDLKCQRAHRNYDKQCGSYCSSPLGSKCKKKYRRLISNYISCNYFERCTDTETEEPTGGSGNTTTATPHPRNYTNVSCVHYGIAYEGADIHNGSGASLPRVPLLGDCVRLCTETDGCRGVTYNTTDSTCQLKDRDEGDRPVYRRHVYSVNLACLVAVKQGRGEVEECIERNVDYYGTDLELHEGVGNIQMCLERCKEVERCVSVTYKEPAQLCYTKYRKYGEHVRWCGDCQGLSLGCLVSDFLPTTLSLKSGAIGGVNLVMVVMVTVRVL